MTGNVDSSGNFTTNDDGVRGWTKVTASAHGMEDSVSVALVDLYMDPEGQSTTFSKGNSRLYRVVHEGISRGNLTVTSSPSIVATASIDNYDGITGLRVKGVGSGTATITIKTVSQTGVLGAEYKFTVTINE